ncbi:Uncharacterized protein, UPF0261 family [Seinonella peptonophila]|uniref:Uncharacterized protein, UPF0261 family n=1 Tax=Seinonella peptonophila TaxID=112248 RepID=A0A1M4T0B7_9BACL|nr:Tm-1-like ATP-binding domain-containing protein [Seinonella peptonophila]SHE37717.1 Uncharacterized protein, UPF0261 family [Seinonella peptonophila]
MTKTIAVIGALDTKGSDYAFVKQQIEMRGHRVLLINTGVLGEPFFPADVTADQVAIAGGSTLDELRTRMDKSYAMEIMTKGVAIVVKQLYEQGKIDAGFSMGGSNGTMIGTSGLRSLPIGVPKVMVSTVASGDTQPYVGISDIVMIPSVLDVSGLNRISAQIYANAVGTIVGMVETEVPQFQGKPLITATMFGNTTNLVNRCKDLIEDRGYEMLVFHATGTGGKTMDSLIEKGYISAVLEMTTTELADELVGGVLTAGPQRMDAAAKWGIPQVIAPGCLDMVNFWGIETVPKELSNRLLYQWNANVTLMRTNVEENKRLGQILAEKVNRCKGPVAVYIPLRGVSELDAVGKEFWWPEADEALFDSLKKNLDSGVPVFELDCNINDELFAQSVTKTLLELMPL